MLHVTRIKGLLVSSPCLSAGRFARSLVRSFARSRRFTGYCLLVPGHWLLVTGYCLLFASACAHTGSQRPQTIEAPSGVIISAFGIAIDASYDPRLDNIIPGYKILNVAIANSSVDPIMLDPVRDTWSLVNARGKKTKAITSLRSVAPEVWQSLPERLRGLIEYQLIIPIGTTGTVDLLFDKGARLEGFRSLTFESDSMGKTFRILAREK